MKAGVRSANLSKPLVVRVLRWPWQRARGYLLRPAPAEHEGLLFLYRTARVRHIHMLGVRFPLGVVWIGPDYKVVGTVLAKPGRVYASPAPVVAFLEIHPRRLAAFRRGDTVRWHKWGTRPGRHGR